MTAESITHWPRLRLDFYNTAVLLSRWEEDGRHRQKYQEQEVQDVAVTQLQADERYGLAGSRQQPSWEAELMDPESKFNVSNTSAIEQRNGTARLISAAKESLFAYSFSTLVKARRWISRNPRL